jgi:hypothetical protein
MIYRRWYLDRAWKQRFLKHLRIVRQIAYLVSSAGQPIWSSDLGWGNRSYGGRTGGVASARRAGSIGTVVVCERVGFSAPRRTSQQTGSNSLR